MQKVKNAIVSFFRGKTPQSVKWEDVREQILDMAIEVASIPTKNYKEVIEIRVPTRFYWNEDGSYDGIEFGPFKTTLLPWQEEMMNRCLDAMSSAISSGDD